MVQTLVDKLHRVQMDATVQGVLLFDQGRDVIVDGFGFRFHGAIVVLARRHGGCGWLVAACETEMVQMRGLATDTASESNGENYQILLYDTRTVCRRRSSPMITEPRAGPCERRVLTRGPGTSCSRSFVGSGRNVGAVNECGCEIRHERGVSAR